MAATPLDNPVWYALTGPHAWFAVGQGRARCYPRDMAPFSAIAEPTPAAYADLALHIADQTEARLFRPENETPPPGWERVSARPIIQMVLDVSVLPERLDAETEIVWLGPADVPEMLALVESTRPGPFGPRTIELGSYVGVRDAQTGSLIAMGGERFSLDHHVELSALAVHPNARGHGLGAAITAYLARALVARGQVAFLHVFPDNPAAALYLCIGFRERARLWVLWHRPMFP
jgi:ribosomal protein S18 acetylase RimI-like enzyme